jgi:hypothetical protein
VWAPSRALRALPRLEDRVSRLVATVGLLADTAEGGFHAVAAELSTVVSPKPPRRESRQKRVVVAATRGQSVEAIAAEEQVAETEIALRLHLANAERTRKEHANAALCL